VLRSGLIIEVLPHLTVGAHGTLQKLSDAESDVQQLLTISATVDGSG
jgi:hypothetical protein